MTAYLTGTGRVENYCECQRIRVRSSAPCPLGEISILARRGRRKGVANVGERGLALATPALRRFITRNLSLSFPTAYMSTSAPRNPPVIPPELLIALLELAYPPSDLTQSSHDERILFGLVCRAWHAAERASSAYYVCGIRRARRLAAELRQRREAGRTTAVLALVYRARPPGAWEVFGETPAPGEAGETLASVLDECPALRELVLWLFGKELGNADAYGTRLVAAFAKLGNLRRFGVDPPDGPRWTTSPAQYVQLLSSFVPLPH